MCSVIPFLMTKTSTVNLMEYLRLLKWFNKFCHLSGPLGQPIMSYTYQSLSNSVYCAESRASFSECSMKMLLMMTDRQLPRHVIFLLKYNGTQHVLEVWEECLVLSLERSHLWRLAVIWNQLHLRSVGRTDVFAMEFPYILPTTAVVSLGKSS
jgi:hypothetical protein